MKIRLLLLGIVGFLLASGIREEGFYSYFDTTAIQNDTVYFNEYILNFSRDSVSLRKTTALRFLGELGLPEIKQNEVNGLSIYKGSYTIEKQNLYIQFINKESNSMTGTDSLFADTLQILPDGKLESSISHRVYHWWLK